MTFVLPKTYMIDPMLNWGNKLLQKDTVGLSEINNFNHSLQSHGLTDDSNLRALVSQLHSKMVDGSLSSSVSSMGIRKSRAEELDWSDYDSDGEKMTDLNSSDVSSHLQHISSTNRLKKAKSNGMNVRRSGRMRC